MKTVSSRLGHANISTTLDIYTKALKSSDKDVADKMDSLLTLNSKRLG
jgi:integrase